MPTLPGYDASRNIQARQAAPFRNEAAQMAENQNKIMGTVTKIAQQWSDAHDTIQLTDAKAKYGVSSMDIEIRAHSDPDFKNTGKYFKELEDAKKTSLEGIDNVAIKNQLSREFDYDNQISTIKIQASAAQKEIEYNRGSIKTSLLTLQNKKANASTEAERLDYQEQINSLMGTNVQAGVVTEDEVTEWNRKAEYNAAENEIYKNPEYGKQKIKNGFYNLSAEDSGRLLNEAMQLEKKNKDFADFQLKQTQTQSMIDLSSALQNKSLTPQMVRTMQQQGVLDSEAAAIFDSIALNKTYEIPESTSLAEPDYFLRAIQDSNGDSKQINKALKDAATAYGNNKIGTNQYLYFIQNAKQSFDKQGKGEFTPSKEQTQVFDAVKAMGKIYTGVAYAEMIGKFFDRYKTGDNPNNIKQDILNEKNLEVNPKIGINPIDGKIMVDKNGNKARVYPDGRIEEIK